MGAAIVIGAAAGSIRPRAGCARTAAGAAARVVLSVALLGSLAGCALGPQPRPPLVIHDFGIAPVQRDAPPRIRASLSLPDPVSPAWLDSNSMIYRLAYADGGQPRIYSRSRWAGTPTELLNARLRARLAGATDPGLAYSRDGVRGDYVLRLELDEFSHVFDSPTDSRGLLRARASLIGGAQRTTIAHRAFSFERPARTADAAGGAAALTLASNDLIDALIDWLAGTVPAKAIVPEPGQGGDAAALR